MKSWLAGRRVLIAAAVVAATLGLAAQNADKMQQEMKATKVKVLDKPVADLSAADIEKLAAVMEITQGNTVLGTVKIKFYPKQAPTHCKNFILLAEKGFYDGVKFHRVIPKVLIQGGDPTGTGAGGPGWMLDAEFSDLPHVRGTLSTARQPSDINSAGSQFFLCLKPVPALDKQYTIYGEVIEGMEVLDKIGSTPTQGERPLVPPVMKKVTIEKLGAPAKEAPKTAPPVPPAPPKETKPPVPAPPKEAGK
jgi:peptidyl-prolyl cis-trans isomerase B (cyclophilin B)